MFNWLDHNIWVLWAIPLLASVWSFYRAYLAHNSGSWYWGKDERGVAKKIETNENVPYTGIGAFWFGVGLVAIAIAIFIVQQIEK